jgi:predicted membrane-bound mannosyltransferase
MAAVLAVVALALRAWDFGNPVIHVDEQYYLLVGDRILPRCGCCPATA